MEDLSYREIDMSTKEQNRIRQWSVIICIVATCFMVSTVSCAKKNYETAVPLAVSEAQQSEQTDDTDSDEDDESENTDERQKFCRANEEAILCPDIVSLIKFGKRHEIQGNFGDDKWSELESTLPEPVLKTSPGQDLIQDFKSKLNLDCTSNSASDLLIYCSKSNGIDRDEEDEEDEDPWRIIHADYLYLCPKDSTTDVRRCYEMASDVEYGEYESGNTVGKITFDVVAVETRSFMDTTGLYIRTKKYDASEREDPPGHIDDIIVTYTTWLFAGDNPKLVTHWVDSEYEYSYEQHDIYEEGGGEYIRSDIELRESYTESYMYYQSGKFERIERDYVHNIDELNKLLQMRP